MPREKAALSLVRIDEEVVVRVEVEVVSVFRFEAGRARTGEVLACHMTLDDLSGEPRGFRVEQLPPRLSHPSLSPTKELVRFASCHLLVGVDPTLLFSDHRREKMVKR